MSEHKLFPGGDLKGEGRERNALGLTPKAES
jgi:hypothetical protein